MTTTPNVRVILPREATATMKDKGSTWLDGSLDRTHEAYHAMLSAAPNAGKVSREELESVAAEAEAVYYSRPNNGRSNPRMALAIRAALSALGLEVEG